MEEEEEEEEEEERKEKKGVRGRREKKKVMTETATKGGSGGIAFAGSFFGRSFFFCLLSIRIERVRFRCFWPSSSLVRPPYSADEIERAGPGEADWCHGACNSPRKGGKKRQGSKKEAIEFFFFKRVELLLPPPQRSRTTASKMSPRWRCLSVAFPLHFASHGVHRVEYRSKGWLEVRQRARQRVDDRGATAQKEKSMSLFFSLSLFSRALVLLFFSIPFLPPPRHLPGLFSLKRRDRT